ANKDNFTPQNTCPKMSRVTAEIITIGDEILYGQILDTNAKWMSETLNEAGVKTIRRTTIGDREDEILGALAEAEARVDIILITGGLGPTKDDLTKPCLARYFNSEMALHEEALQDVIRIFESKGRELTEVNRLQAVLPTTCEKITNAVGTAPGMWFEREGTVFVSMPGVPYEMKMMMTDHITPKLRDTFDMPVIYHKLIKTIGIGESWLAEIIDDWADNLPENMSLAYLPSLAQVKLRITALGGDREELEREVARQVELVKPLISQYIFGYDQDTIESVMGHRLKEEGLTISTAESCSGGYLAHMITSVPGSSTYFIGSMVSYHNDIKTDQLGVNPQTIEAHGAVSEQTVLEMASNIRKKFGTDIGLATSGVAGPGGGSEEKPVGTVWIAYADEEGAIARKLQLGTQRNLNIQLSALHSLNFLRQQLNAKSEITI
ncbi:MAG: competence/damage-inducible protein A, partial [Bacteroidota bacterium]